MSKRETQQALNEWTLLLRRRASISKSNHISKIFKSTRQIASLPAESKQKHRKRHSPSLSLDSRAKAKKICMKKFIFRKIFISLAFQSSPKVEVGARRISPKRENAGKGKLLNA